MPKKAAKKDKFFKVQSLSNTTISLERKCTGMFENDLERLGREKQLPYIPPVVLRPKSLVPFQSFQEQFAAASMVSSKMTLLDLEGKGKGENRRGVEDSGKLGPPESKKPTPAKGALTQRKTISFPETDSQRATRETERRESGDVPTTFTTRDKLEFFRPTIQVELEVADNPESVSGIYTRGWTLEAALLEVFEQCWPPMKHLHTISLWRVGLTKETLEILIRVVCQCRTLKDLMLDANPLPEQCHFLLLEADTTIQNLSLRHCSIDNAGARGLGLAMLAAGDDKISPSSLSAAPAPSPSSSAARGSRLLSLNLNGNHIEDEGLEFIARALRLNRSLLTLSLGNNRIGDRGAARLAAVLVPFPLTHEEVVERRLLLAASQAPPARASALSAMAECLSAKSSLSMVSEVELDDKASSEEVTRKKPDKKTKGKDGKDKEQKDKDGKEGAKGGKLSKVKEAKEKELGRKRGGKADERLASEGSGKTRDAKEEEGKEGKKGGKKEGRGRGRRDKGAKQLESEVDLAPKRPVSQVAIQLPQLLEEPVEHQGQLVFPGNRSLISLGLAHNGIGEAGLRALLKAVTAQESLPQSIKRFGKGLMRLHADRNAVSPDSYLLQRLKEVMSKRDPIFQFQNLEISVPVGLRPDDGQQ